MPIFNAENVTRAAYEATSARMRVPPLRAVVRHGLSILYGPPIERPDLALITFQGGGVDKTAQTT